MGEEHSRASFPEYNFRANMGVMVRKMTNASEEADSICCTKMSVEEF